MSAGWVGRAKRWKMIEICLFSFYIIFRRVVVGLNKIFFPDGIGIISLVLGFLPCFAFLDLTLKEPSHDKEITSPFFRLIV